MLPVAFYQYRSAVRSRWRSYAALALLLGVLGGITLGAFAGARRTASAVGRFLESTNPSDLSLNAGAYDPDVSAQVAGLPQVVGETTYVAFNVAVGDESGALVPNIDIGEAVGSLDGRFLTQDRLAVVEGRLPDPDRAEEVAINELAAAVNGFEVGDDLALAILTDEQLEDPGLLDAILAGEAEPAARQDVTVVGVGVFNDEIAQDEADQLPRLLLTPAFTRPKLALGTYAWQGVQLDDPAADVDGVAAAFADAVPDELGTVTRVTADDAAAAQRVVRPLAVALGVFGAVAAVVTVLLVAQALVRLLAAEREDSRVLRSIGASSATRLAAMVLSAATPLLAGVAMAVGVAVLVSPLIAVGPTASVEPDQGFHLDRTAVLGGAAVLLIVLGGVALLLSRLELGRASGNPTASPRRSRATATAARSGLPLTAVAGLRLALEPGQGRSAVPVRAAAFGAVIAVAAVVAALTFRSSLDTLGSHPELYGWSWDVTVVDDGGYGGFDLDRVAEVLDDEPAVDRWAWMYFGETRVDGRAAAALALDPTRGIAPPVLQGRPLAGRDEVVLGAGMLADIGKSIGDEVVIVTDAGDRTVTVVGTAALPALGRIHGVHPSLGDGVVMSDVDIPPSDNVGSGELGPPALLLQMQADTDPDITERITTSLAELGIYPGSADIGGVLEPAELVHRDDLGRTPVVLAGTLAGAALASLGLTLTASVRRRRVQLGLFKVLGFTSRQLAATIAWQAAVTVTIGLLVGVPVGIAAGGSLWRLFAGELHVVARVTVPVLTLVIGAAAALLAAVGLALIPALVAARTRTAAALRAE